MSIGGLLAMAHDVVRSARHSYESMSSAMTRRVAFLHGGNDNYGASRVLVGDVGILRSLGWDVDVLLPEDGPLTAALRDVGAQVEICDLHILRRSSLSRTRLPVSLPATVAAADLVVLWTLGLSPYLGVLAFNGKPNICSVHEIQPGLSGAIFAWIVTRLAGGLMANSTATASWLRRGGGLGTDPAVAYPIAPAYDPLPQPLAARPFRALLAGRVNGYKGHVEAISACQIARTAGLDVRLTLLGSPFRGQEAHLEALKSAMEGRDWIAYLGQVDNIRPHLADAHVLLIPTTRPESFGIVALEAWAAGRPVLAADVGGLSEAADLVGGKKFRSRDVHGLARLLLEVSREGGAAEHTDGSAPVATLCSLAQREVAWRQLLARVMGDGLPVNSMQSEEARDPRRDARGDPTSVAANTPGSSETKRPQRNWTTLVRHLQSASCGEDAA
jgi:glycosyltransferase involved in cell wall biosynthesis